MRCIRLSSRDPYFCLAAEEYLMKEFTDDIFMLWQSDDTVVIGKHQNAMGEINYRYVHEQNITVARRISGGGTVFHDSGNLNFAYIKNVGSTSEISFTRFIQPITEALGSLGITATTSGRNDLLLDGKKVSGNAQHIFKNRVLHHGTLLFNSNLQTLGSSIKVIPGLYRDKAVQSNRSIVTNILPYLENEMTLEAFTGYLLDFELARQGNWGYALTGQDIQAISRLQEEKFRTWEWNYGYSPRYTFQKEDTVDGRQLVVTLNVEKGHITEAVIEGEYFSVSIARAIASGLMGRRHFYGDVASVIREITGEAASDLVFAFF